MLHGTGFFGEHVPSKWEHFVGNYSIHRANESNHSRMHKSCGTCRVRMAPWSRPSSLTCRPPGQRVKKRNHTWKNPTASRNGAWNSKKYVFITRNTGGLLWFIWWNNSRSPFDLQASTARCRIGCTYIRPPKNRLPAVKTPMRSDSSSSVAASACCCCCCWAAAACGRQGFQCCLWTQALHRGNSGDQVRGSRGLASCDQELASENPSKIGGTYL